MESPMLCPKCGGENLHHDEVQVWNRTVEDGPGMKTIVYPDGGSNTLAAKAGFEGRRGDVRIRFSCEGCSMTKWLFIIQHKGSTLLKWSDGDQAKVI